MATECARKVINLEMSINQYSLYFLVPLMNQLVKVPVRSLEDAEKLVNTLVTDRVTGVRIARMDPEQGCESVLYKFS